MAKNQRIGMIESILQLWPDPERHRYCMKQWRSVVCLFLLLELIFLAAFAGSIVFIDGVPGVIAAFLFLSAFGYFNYWLMAAVEVDVWLRKEYRERVLRPGV